MKWTEFKLAQYLCSTYLEFFTVQAEQLRPIHPSGSELCSVLVHVHGDQPQTNLLAAPLQDGSTLPQVVVDGGNWVTVQCLPGYRGKKGETAEDESSEAAGEEQEGSEIPNKLKKKRRQGKRRTDSPQRRRK